MKTLLIVYHSLTGGTSQMAHAAAKGAATVEEARVNLIRATETGPAQVIDADGYIFATPENLAAMSGLMKDFFDRTYYAALDRINGRPYASLICAGSDGMSALAQVERIATGWRLRKVCSPVLVCTHAQTREAILKTKVVSLANLARCEEQGATLAAGMVAGIF